VNDRPGEALQKLVATLERSLSTQQGVTFESPKRLRDKDTGQWREHDVVITRRDAHHTILTSIEVRDTGRKLGVPAVEAFAHKCRRTGVHHGMMVSGRGFTATARKKAAAHDIICMELAEVEHFDWMGINFFVRIERNISHINADVFFEETKPELPFKVANSDKVEMTPAHLANVVYKALEENAFHPPVDQDTLVLVRAYTPGWTAEGSDGVHYSIKFMELSATVSVRQSYSTVATHSYVGGGANYAVATTDVKIGEVEGKIVFIRDDESIRVTWTPNATDPKPS
jgi:hypothetical protein